MGMTHYTCHVIRVMFYVPCSMCHVVELIRAMFYVPCYSCHVLLVCISCYMCHVICVML